MGMLQVIHSLIHSFTSQSPRSPIARMAKGTTLSRLPTSCLAASRRASLASKGSMGSRQSDAVCASIALMGRVRTGVGQYHKSLGRVMCWFTFVTDHAPPSISAVKGAASGEK